MFQIPFKFARFRPLKRYPARLGMRQIFLKRKMITSIASWIILVLGVRAHGDHTEGVHMGTESLVYYDQVPENAFQKVAQNEMIGSIEFKKR